MARKFKKSRPANFGKNCQEMLKMKHGDGERSQNMTCIHIAQTMIMVIDRNLIRNQIIFLDN